MSYMPVTPFRRAMSGDLLEEIQQVDEAVLPEAANKWDILRDLTVARKEIGVTDRALRVLQALLSFHPETELTRTGNLVVFPSNAAICERLNGMACSTMRRHLGALVDAGLLLRRDSPNGKRFTRRDRSGMQAFGFDLRLLLAKSGEISAIANAARAADDAYKRQRQAVSLMRRDLASLVTYAKSTNPDFPLWDQLDDLVKLTARDLRRQLVPQELEEIRGKMEAAIGQAKRALGWKTPELSTNDAQNEQHHQNSKKEYKNNLKDIASKQEPTNETQPIHKKNREESTAQDMPLALVASACPEAFSYSPQPIRNWRDVLSLAKRLRPMMGIPISTWEGACREMGSVNASVVLICILQRFNEIRTPSAYLQFLTGKAAKGAFSCLPMVLALVNRQEITVHSCEL